MELHPGPIAQHERADKVQYTPKSKDPVIKEMEEKNIKSGREREAEAQRIRDEQAKLKEKQAEQAKDIRFDFSKIQKPSSPGLFKQAFHFEPSRQYLHRHMLGFQHHFLFRIGVLRLLVRLRLYIHVIYQRESSIDAAWHF